MTICTLVKQKPLRQPRMTNFTKFHKQAVHKAKNKEVWDLDPSTDFLFNKKYRNGIVLSSIKDTHVGHPNAIQCRGR